MPGVGHDYLRMLDETVNPANGALSLRITAPVPKQRGEVNFPYNLFSYDSNGVNVPLPGFFSSYNAATGASYSMGISWTDSSVQPGQVVTGLIPGGFVANAQVGRTTWKSASISSQISGVSFVTCSYANGYVYTDPNGTRHSLGQMSYVISSTNGGCGVLGIPTIPVGGDKQYQAQITTNYFPVYVADLHGRVVSDT